MNFRAFAAGLALGIGATAFMASLGAPALATALAVVNCASGSACTEGNNTGGGNGVLGTATSGNGLVGRSSKGSGVIGITQTGSAGVLGSSKTTNAVSGLASTSGTGVMGTSASGDGVHGKSQSSAGVFGESGNDVGVQGNSDNFIGTAGVSSTDIGLYGNSSSGTAVDAISDSSYGVLASSNSNVGVYAKSGNYIGLRAETGGGVSGSVGALIKNSSGNGADVTGTYIGLVSRGPANGFPLVLTDPGGANLFYVDGAGNVYYHGSLHAFARTAGGHDVATYDAKTATPALEDAGSARLVNGMAVVYFDRTFASGVDPRVSYHVMLTPDGDTRGLFVARKDARGFVVREVQGGRGSFDFDYHVYATPLGQAGERMTDGPANALHVPHAPPLHLPAAPQQPVLRAHAKP